MRAYDDSVMVSSAGVAMSPSLMTIVRRDAGDDDAALLSVVVDDLGVDVATRMTVDVDDAGRR